MSALSKPYRGAPTLKQVKTLQNLSKGMSMRKAMIQAGYSVKTANKGKYFFKNQKVQDTIIQLREQIRLKGINNDKIADKFVEWIDATKTQTSHTEPDKMVPDYDIQIKAYDRLKDIWGSVDNPKVKKRLTIEEFVNEENAA